MPSPKSCRKLRLVATGTLLINTTCITARRTMTIVSKLFSFPGLALAAAVEALVAVKLYPNYWGPQGHLKALGAILAINNTFGVIFWTILYPRLLSPLRRIPGPKVRFRPPHFPSGLLTPISRTYSAPPTAP